MALARADRSAQRFYSMSARIRIERNDYYTLLERTQKGELDVTPWLTWFLQCLYRAIEGAQEKLAAVMNKARFWEQFAKEPLNERQIKVLNRVLDGFEGKLTTSKGAKYQLLLRASSLANTKRSNEFELSRPDSLLRS